MSGRHFSLLQGDHLAGLHKYTTRFIGPFFPLRKKWEPVLRAKVYSHGPLSQELLLDVIKPFAVEPGATIVFAVQQAVRAACRLISQLPDIRNVFTHSISARQNHPEMIGYEGMGNILVQMYRKGATGALQTTRPALTIEWSRLPFRSQQLSREDDIAREFHLDVNFVGQFHSANEGFSSGDSSTALYQPTVAARVETINDFYDGLARCALETVRTSPYVDVHSALQMIKGSLRRYIMSSSLPSVCHLHSCRIAISNENKETFELNTPLNADGSEASSAEVTPFLAYAPSAGSIASDPDAESETMPRSSSTRTGDVFSADRHIRHEQLRDGQSDRPSVEPTPAHKTTDAARPHTGDATAVDPSVQAPPATDEANDIPQAQHQNDEANILFDSPCGPNFAGLGVSRRINDAVAPVSAQDDSPGVLPSHSDAGTLADGDQAPSLYSPPEVDLTTVLTDKTRTGAHAIASAESHSSNVLPLSSNKRPLLESDKISSSSAQGNTGLRLPSTTATTDDASHAAFSSGSSQDSVDVDDRETRLDTPSVDNTEQRLGGQLTLDQLAVVCDESFGKSESPGHRGAYIALGSNIGDRLSHIEEACREIDADPDMHITRTSALYETEPMYVEDQGSFLNGVCQPMQLLDRLQAIEQRLGRVKLIDKGPRNIDLDILVYQGVKMQEPRLTIPHPLMVEREFVLRPLHDLVSVPQIRTQMKRLVDASRQPMYYWTAFGPRNSHVIIPKIQQPTQVMSIINVTPDSFSDGGQYSPADTSKFKALIRAQIAAGATILDIGGQSSRPNAPDVTAAEEIARVVPAIEAIRSVPEFAGIAISVDTYRAAVAEAAVKAGAHIINDISAGQLDSNMLSTVAKLGCTYIMMHMRGTPATMQSTEDCSYPAGLLPTIAKELSERVEAAEAAGIRRWRIMLDPGIGFSKTVAQNLEILKNLQEFTRGGSPRRMAKYGSYRLRSFAWLVGSSRKSFIGKITGVEKASERGWGTAVTVSQAIASKAAIVRIHDAEEMAAVVKMADALRMFPYQNYSEP